MGRRPRSLDGLSQREIEAIKKLKEYNHNYYYKRRNIYLAFIKGILTTERIKNTTLREFIKEIMKIVSFMYCGVFTAYLVYISTGEVALIDIIKSYSLVMIVLYILMLLNKQEK